VPENLVSDCGKIADGLHQFRVGSQPRAELECPGLVVSLGIIERHCDFQVAEIGAPEALRHAQRFCMRIASNEPFCYLFAAGASTSDCIQALRAR